MQGRDLSQIVSFLEVSQAYQNLVLTQWKYLPDLWEILLKSNGDILRDRSGYNFTSYWFLGSIFLDIATVQI